MGALKKVFMYGSSEVAMLIAQGKEKKMLNGHKNWEETLLFLNVDNI